MVEHQNDNDTKTDGQTEFDPVDLSDPDCASLAEFAGRIATLLDEVKVKADPNMQGCLDDFVGAVYALLFARQRGFEDRTGKPIEPAAVLTRARQVSEGKVRREGKWMAGFYFNSALFRIAAVYHRVLKITGGKPTCREWPHELLPDVETLYRQWKGTAWSSASLKLIYGQVNELKHESPGVYHRRTVKYRDAVASVGELLDLIEAWAR